MDKRSVLLIHEKAKFFHEIYDDALRIGQVPADIPFEHLLRWERAYKTNKSGINKRLRLYKNNNHNVEIECGLQWSDSLVEVFNLYQQMPKSGVKRRPDIERPYRLLIMPFQSWVLANLKKQNLFNTPMLASALELFSEYILDELERISNDCFHEFYSELIKEEEIESYSTFVDWFLLEGYHRFFVTYASLARLLIITSSKWVEKITYFAEAFRTDYVEIQDSLLNGDEQRIEQVTLISGLGHSNVGNNLIVQFDSGTKILFKPKSANTDLIYQRLVQWINNTGITHKLMAYKVVDKNKHSWHEYVSIEPVTNLVHCHDYYHRIGTIAALLQSCGARDYHFENVRAHGAQPVCTDHESILSHLYVVGDTSRYFGDIAIAKGIHHSIALSGLLTSYLHSIYHDPPSIDAVFNDRDAYERFAYGLDADLRPIKTTVNKERKGENIPIVDGHKMNPQDYIGDIAAGYEECIGIVKAGSSELSRLMQDATNDWNMKTRILIRPSPYYAALLKQSLTAKYLKSGIYRSFYFEEIATFYFEENHLDDSQYLLNTELASLLNFYSPWFHNDVKQSSFTNGETDFFRSSAQRVFIDHVNHLVATGKSVLMEQFHHIVKKQVGSVLKAEDPFKAIVDNMLFSYKHYFDLPYLRPEELRSYYSIEKGMGGIALLWAAAYKIFNEDKYADGVNLFLGPLFEGLTVEELNNPSLDYLYSIEKLGVPLGLSAIQKTAMNNLCLLAQEQLDYNNSITRIMCLKRIAHRREELGRHDDFINSLKDYHLLLHNEISEAVDESIIDWSMSYGVSGKLIESELLNRILIRDYKDYSDLYEIRLNHDTEWQSDSILFGAAGFIETALMYEIDRSWRQRFINYFASQIEQNGKFSLNPYYHDLSFLTGVSGVVYQYFRLLHPTDLPSMFLD